MILDGKVRATELKNWLKNEAAQVGRPVTLAVILVGNDPASQLYVRSKTNDCREVGIISQQHLLSENTTQEQLMELIERLNNDPSVNGILVQFPLPHGLDEAAVVKAISPKKDVDGFSTENLGRLLSGDFDGLIPCTPAGVLDLIKFTGCEIRGKNAVIIGRSHYVGKPMALLLLAADATVTVCHSKTENLAKICREADILISAVGKPHFVTKDMVKPGAIVIDVGISKKDGKICGDIDFDSVAPIAGFITPMPGGTGPMTRAMLMYNTIKAAERQ